MPAVNEKWRVSDGAASCLPSDRTYPSSLLTARTPSTDQAWRKGRASGGTPCEAPAAVVNFTGMTFTPFSRDTAAVLAAAARYTICKNQHGVRVGIQLRCGPYAEGHSDGGDVDAAVADAF